MVAAALAVSRMWPALTWRALDGDLVRGEVSTWLRPGNRWLLYFDTWRADAYPPLADAVARDLGCDLCVTLENAEYDALDACAQAGLDVLSPVLIAPGCGCWMTRYGRTSPALRAGALSGLIQVWLGYGGHDWNL